ncbi:MAG: sodium:solute symporter [Oscillospiraceae bacterium]|jgi:SSS family solute:Na+ symporter/sodium/proline symporter|nr:sodium:solute symporter [Oscillospiraceae bacterium]
MDTQTIALIFLAAFAVMMVAIGVLSTRQSKSLDGFVLGGRNVGAWMSAFAFGTSYFSAVIFVGYAGTFGWRVGIGGIWVGIANGLIGALLAWALLAKPTRRMTHNLDTRTMPEFFEKRYGAKGLKFVAALIIFIFLVPYAASVYKGLGMFFGEVFTGAGSWFPGMSAATVCMLIVAVLTGVYLVLGGYIAVAWTDFVQGLIMIGGAIALMFAVVTRPEVGGLAAGLKKLGEFTDEFGKTGQLNNLFSGNVITILLPVILLTSIGTFGLPHMVHKFYAIRDDKAIKRAAVISTVFSLIIGCGAYFTGAFSRLFLEEIPEGGYDAIMPTMLMGAFSGSGAGKVLLALLILLLLSASMSTLSSLVLSSSTAVTVDFIQTVKPDFDKKVQMLLTRLFCLVFVALSFVFANSNITIIVSLMSFSWGVVAGCFIGPFLWGLLWKGATKAGAWAGMAGAFLTVVVMTLVSMFQHGGFTYAAFQTASRNAPTFGAAAMVVSIVIVPLVSLITKKLSKDIIDRAFGGAADVAA